MNMTPPGQSQAHFVSSEHCSWTFSQACNHTFPEGGGVKLGTRGGGGYCVCGIASSVSRARKQQNWENKFTDLQPRLMVKVH